MPKKASQSMSLSGGWWFNEEPTNGATPRSTGSVAIPPPAPAFDPAPRRRMRNNEGYAHEVTYESLTNPAYARLPDTRLAASSKRVCPSLPPVAPSRWLQPRRGGGNPRPAPPSPGGRRGPPIPRSPPRVVGHPVTS